jgi:hypothetical protein
MNPADKPLDSGGRAIEFVRNLHDRYATYHSHKESMAFTGLTLFSGAAGAARSSRINGHHPHGAITAGRGPFSL